MRLCVLLFTAICVAGPAIAQQAQPSSSAKDSKSTEDTKDTKDTKDLNLPVSVDKIKDALQQTPLLSLRTIDERPTFRMQILERQKIEELMATLNFKAGPVPAGGVYMYEQQRQMFNAVDRPLMQPYAAFNQGELLTILIENLVGKYLGGRAIDAISKSERAHAEAAAKEEVRTAVEQYCNAQPNAGAGIQICSSVGR
jgi:ribosomal protein L12E/L44/L45/RPP1/RPP2